MVTTNDTSGDEEKVYEILLHGIKARMNERVFMGNFGAMRNNDEITRGYYLVR